jgi:VIT1/CCC1 family predicted Fe2+/Mn2+ transporter
MTTPMLTDVARYVLALLMVVCVAALCLGIAVWASGRHSDDPHASARGRTGVLVAITAAVCVLVLVLV